MLVSANEAAAAIAEHISGSTTEFAKLMTKRAKELGCTNTQFKNLMDFQMKNITQQLTIWALS